GAKRWITFGRWADVFLVLGRTDGRPVTVLVEADRPGIEVKPVRDPLGLRGARLAHVLFRDVEVPVGNRIAPPGFGLSHVMGTALDHGRFTVGWGSVGMARSCLDETVAHVVARRQGGVALAEHQLVRS